jgi:hypothetical protein
MSEGKVQTTLRFGAAERQAWIDEAARRGMTLTGLIEAALRETLRNPVPKSEQNIKVLNIDKGISLSQDSISVAQLWEAARRVREESWREMLQSIRTQLSLVAMQSEKESS